MILYSKHFYQQLQHWYIKCNSKENLSLHTIGEQIKSSLLIKLLLQLVYSYFSFHLLTLQIFISAWEKSHEGIYYSPPCFFYYRKHPNNNKIPLPLPCSSGFQQHFHDLLKYNSVLLKLEWTPLLFNFKYIHNLTNKHRLFSIPVTEYASFSHQARSLKTNLLDLISKFSKYY